MHRRHFLAAQAWYAISQGAPAFLNPFLNLFFHRIGLSPSQIGLLSALRPWISAPCGSIIAGLADRWGSHRPLLLACYLGMTWIQGLMALPSLASFGAMLALTVLSSVVYTPASILADAAVMAASTHPGDYGRLRTWASVSWTAFAPLAGWVNSSFGIRVGIVCFCVGSMLAVPAAWMLPVEALRRRVAPIIQRRPSCEPEAAPPTPGLEQPLLAEEAPPPTPAAERPLTRALAIVRRVAASRQAGSLLPLPPRQAAASPDSASLLCRGCRFIETITELGVVPPGGAGLYGYATLPLHYAAQHLAPVEESPREAAAFAGYSPFAGGAEPGSESPPSGTSPSTAPPVGNGFAPTADASGEGAAPGGGPAACPGSPLAPPSPAAPRPGLRPTHGSLQDLGRRPATLPRPISADSLGRVASLRAGIPRVRTRPLLLVPQEEVTSESEEEGGEEEEETISPDSGKTPPAACWSSQPSSTDLLACHALHRSPPVIEQCSPAAAQLTRYVVLTPHGAPTQERPHRAQPEQEEGTVFDADDLPATGQGASRRLQGAPSASRMLGDVRGIGTPPPPAAGAGPQPVAGQAGSGELPVSYGSPQQADQAVGAQAPAPAPLQGVEAAEAATPAFRSAAVHRLAQLFGGTSRGRAGRGGAAADPARAGSSGSGGDAEAGSPAQTPSAAGEEAVGFSPVRRYLDYRWAGYLDYRLGGALFGSITPSLVAASQLQGPQVQQVGPEAMREALELELAEVAQEQDPTGSMIVGMLSKKLESMAADSQRKQRLRRRAAARAQAAAPAAPGAAEGAAAPPPLASVPEQGEAAAGGVKEAPLGFGAALKRLLGDPQVATFFWLCTVLGFGHGMVGGFLFMYLAQLGGSEMLMGCILVANALPELPAFFFFGSILAALGMNTVLLAACATLGLRVWAYSVGTCWYHYVVPLLLPSINLNWIVAIETLHAVTYACGWSASAVNSSKIAPPGLESTTQGLFQGLWTGVGCGVAGLVGGLLYDSHGPELLFRLSGERACRAAASLDPKPLLATQHTWMGV
ncbi:hypothetical protein CHLNCDRAFT_50056 [Chlorella variabilis]|uniref:Major facilitator superfamily associated domain-containing protein n=1 Tax=Chlorella variabilis TaxID=554065 RepID=E1Z5B0_CHLVA|nr:hypothetical protein CHLNCDRAFT_50056 [Chlorella variabilis]EFN59197.1 hypothetical protein CHLNCDRAFT_50056 [Chlorella variabilis]|eukprot:XP_005851299.1 hypothetical protein CHLNCDRAFT_50056 [Chlorella variabilis]